MKSLTDFICNQVFKKFAFTALILFTSTTLASPIPITYLRPLAVYHRHSGGHNPKISEGRLLGNMPVIDKGSVSQEVRSFVSRDEFRDYDLVSILGERKTDLAWLFFFRHKSSPSKDIVVKKSKDPKFNIFIVREEAILTAYTNRWGEGGVMVLSKRGGTDRKDSCSYLYMRPNPPGTTLFERVRRDQRLPLSLVRDIGIQIGKVLHNFHEIGICPADIKLENIWISDDGGVILNDLGGAYLMSGEDPVFQVPTNFVGIPSLGNDPFYLMFYKYGGRRLLGFQLGDTSRGEAFLPRMAFC